jgi:GTP-binding protein HflX
VENRLGIDRRFYLEKLRQTLRIRKERAILVAAIPPGEDSDDLVELTALVESAGGFVVDRFQQKIRTIKPATYIGKGKAAELAGRVKRFKANVIVFDNDLSPRQIRELEESSGCKVLDRSELILDIFATRARTYQAKLQVELAQLEYTYPRLTRMWSHLDSVAGAGGATAAGIVGGIGTRGPGEKQLEIDRRIVNRRITDLKTELEHIDSRRVMEINGRRGMFKICLVGYTNAGKSTLLNRLTDADVLVEDRLFATLDTRTRKWPVGGGITFLLSDTVGFIRNLPHQLVASFKATLEEAVNADLLLHVVDASNPDAARQIESADAVLREIGCAGKRMLMVFNKIDVVQRAGGVQFEMLETLFPEAVCISAKTGLGLEQLKATVAERYRGSQVLLRVSASQSDGKIQGFLKACGMIINRQYCDGAVILDVWLGRNQLVELERLGPQKIEVREEPCR